MERIDRRQDTLTVQHDDSVVTMGAAERAEKMVRGVQEETRTLSEQVSALHRQVRRLDTEIRKLRGEEA